MKTQTLILIISAIIIVLIIPTKSEGSKVSILNSNGDISINLYDKSGTLIKSQESFSIINSSETNYKQVTGVYSIDFTVKLQNKGTRDLSCNIVNATPTLFYNSLPTNSLDLIYGKTSYNSWTSNKINTTILQNETSPIIFNVTVRCVSNETILKSNYITIWITKDKPIYTLFRTTKLDYQSSSAIAYTSTCGSNLDRYGYFSQALGWTSGTCDDSMSALSTCGNPSKVFNIPFLNSTNPYILDKLSLWKSSDSNILCVCFDGHSENEIQIMHTVKKYVKNSGNYNTVSNSPNPINQSLEVLCQ